MELPIKRNFFDKVNNLYFSFFLVGYEKEGESIVILLYSEEPKKIFFIGVIDCYESDTVNITTKIIKDFCKDFNKQPKIDMLCWTHPHDDHSIGIEELLKHYCTKATLILYPNIMMLDSSKLSDNANKIRSTLSQLNYGLQARNRYNVNFASGNKEYYSVDFAADQNLRMTIKGLGPYDNIGFFQNFEGKINLNKLSVALLIEINNKYIFLGGDTDDMNIDAFDSFPENIHICKIPHHTSQTAKKLLQKINKDIYNEIACTTVVKKSNIPDKNLISDYKEYFQSVYCTSSDIDAKGYELMDNDNKESLDNKYGLIHIKLDVIKNSYEPFFGGDVVKLV